MGVLLAVRKSVLLCWHSKLCDVQVRKLVHLIAHGQPVNLAVSNHALAWRIMSHTSVFCRKRLANDTPSFVVLLLGAAVADTAAAGAAAAAGGAAGVDPQPSEAAAAAPPLAEEPQPSSAGPGWSTAAKLVLAGTDSPHPSDVAAGAADVSPQPFLHTVESTKHYMESPCT